MPLGLGTGPDAGDEPALFADGVGLLGRVERDGSVEVSEEDDHQPEDGDVPEVVGLQEVLVDRGADRVPDAADGQHVGEQNRQVEHRAGEDDRDDPGLVHLQRDVAALAPVLAPAHHPLGELDGDAALALLDEDDGHQHQQRHEHHDGELEVAALGAHQGAARGDAADHRGEDDQRHAVAHPPLGDELAQPHDEGGAGGQGQHHQHDPGHGELGDEVDGDVAEEAPAAVVEQESQPGGLQQGQRHGEVAGPLGDLLLAHRPLLLPLLQLGDHHGQHLHDDGGGDVGHDPQPEHGQAGQRPAGEEAQEAEHATLVGLLLQLLHGGEVDPRGGDVGPQPVEGDDSQREQDLVPQVHDFEHVPQAGQHRQRS